MKILSLNEFEFSRRGQALVGQEMFKVLERARELEREGKEILHLELGNPRLRPPDVIIEETVRILQERDVGYTFSAGVPALRRAIAKHYSQKNDVSLSLEDVVISPANFIINQFLDIVCNRDDRVVFFTPAFPTYWAGASYIGLDVVSVELDKNIQYRLTKKNVDDAIAAKPKAILVNSANNPTGAVYDEEVLLYLAQQCENEKIWLLSDETYGEVVYEKDFFSLMTIKAPHVVVMSSFSKMFSIPGYRIGFAICDPIMVEKLSLSISTQISCLPAFTQYGCEKGLAEIDEYSKSVRRRFQIRTELCARLLESCKVLSCEVPDSGFYVFVDISKTGLKDVDFCQRLLEEKLTAVTPGSSFGPQYTDYIRIAACLDQEHIKQGVDRIKELAESLTSI
jgi:aspartate/methionine/tyrosine aminotransferase